MSVRELDQLLGWWIDHGYGRGAKQAGQGWDTDVAECFVSHLWRFGKEIPQTSV